MSQPVTTFTYWQSGNGDPYTGGVFGRDSVTTIDGETIATSTTSAPPAAVSISEAAHAALEASFLAEWEVRAIGGQAFVTDVVEATAALRSDARAALINGVPLTPEQAAVL